MPVVHRLVSVLVIRLSWRGEATKRKIRRASPGGGGGARLYHYTLGSTTRETTLLETRRDDQIVSVEVARIPSQHYDAEHRTRRHVARASRHDGYDNRCFTPSAHLPGPRLNPRVIRPSSPSTPRISTSKSRLLSTLAVFLFTNSSARFPDNDAGTGPTPSLPSFQFPLSTRGTTADRGGR